MSTPCEWSTNGTGLNKMLQKEIKYKEWRIEVHVGGAKAFYKAFDTTGEYVAGGYNLAWVKKDLNGLNKVI
jgi:hypothetical protein